MVERVTGNSWILVHYCNHKTDVLHYTQALVISYCTACTYSISLITPIVEITDTHGYFLQNAN
nr:hypothetical protein [Mucilaginibacter sp. SP1R1]